ncbi:MAG TPA: integrase [Candidatus Melainabacteria bacterium]|nr:integrase [Candidatus Melainabacteria bacterium]HIN63504.1 integrase [Candidatus Obscuribacterales bacterium]
MTTDPNFAVLLQTFFTQRLMKQRQASPHTISSYRDSFCLLLQFMRRRLRKEPSLFRLEDVDAPLIAAFLDDIEQNRSLSVRSRNQRLTAIRSFFRYAALEAPAQAAQIQRVLAIPSKRHASTEVTFLDQKEVASLLAAPNQQAWSGRRDHALILLTVQTGARLSEIIGLKRQDVVFGAGAHIRVIGKGRKERCVPLTKRTAQVLKAWLREPAKVDTDVLFPNAHGTQLSSDGMQYILAKHTKVAANDCSSLGDKRVTPHTLRHTCAMEMLHAGIDRAMIALWLGHESVETTQIYLHANLELKESILAKTSMPEGKPGRYRPDDRLLEFLKDL